MAYSLLFGLGEAEAFEGMSTKIMLVDDHGIMRDGVKRILQNSTDLIVTGEAENGTDCLSLCAANKPDVVVMDIGLPDLSGIEVTAELSRRHPAIKVLILSMYDDEQSVLGAIEAGARGFVQKKASDGGELRDALHTVASGGFYISPQVADRLFLRIRAGGVESQANTPFLERLSAREQQVFRLVAEGKSNKEIAVLLRLALHTVRSYRKTLMTKLEVHNVAGLTRLALASGLVHHPKPVSEAQKKRDG